VTTKLPGRRRSRARRSGSWWIGWLFAAPALLVYTFFVLRPLALTVQYSLYKWNGVTTSKWVGMDNYRRIFTDPEMYATIFNAFYLILFFSVLPVGLGLVVAATIRSIARSAMATVARTVLFLPQVIPLVAAGIMWTWLYAPSGLINQVLTAIGLGGITRAWLGDFDTALPAVGVIGGWVQIGLCTLLLLAGMSKIDPGQYESARIDGAGAIREFISITVPGVRREIGICVTVTVISALAAFDIVYVSTQGGPGNTTMVPGLEIFYLAFSDRQVGMASALAVVLMVLVLIVVLPLQWLTRAESR